MALTFGKINMSNWEKIWIHETQLKNPLNCLPNWPNWVHQKFHPTKPRAHAWAESQNTSSTSF